MKKQKELISIDIISAASHGDIDAINTILRHYKGYITALSMREVYDSDGNCYTILDEELKQRLETKLITKILEFKIA